MTFPQIILHYLVMILSKTKGGFLNTLLPHSHCMSYPLSTTLSPAPSSQTAIMGPSILPKWE